MSHSFRRDSVTLCYVPSSLARVGAGCDRDRVKRGAYLSCWAIPCPISKAAFQEPGHECPLCGCFCARLTAHDSSFRAMICFQSIPSSANSLAAVARTKYCMFKISGCHLECHRRGRWCFSVSFLREAPFQQLSFCLSHLQSLLQHEHTSCMSNFMGRCCDSSLPAKPPAEAYWRNIVLPSNGWHCNIGLLIETAFGSGQSENVDFLSVEGNKTWRVPTAWTVVLGRAAISRTESTNFWILMAMIFTSASAIPCPNYIKKESYLSSNHTQTHCCLV